MLKQILILLFAIPLYISSAFCHAENDALAVKQIQLFSEAFHQIKQHYVKPISDEELMQHAISGMLNQLDPHSAWLTKDDFADLQEMTEGEFTGIGVEVIPEGDYLRIVTPLDGSPAEKAGILPNDRITAINKQSLKNMLYSESIELMRGKEGSLVNLQIQREDEKKLLHFKIKRSKIKVDSVKSELLENNIAYLRIAQFQKNTAKETNEHLNQLKAQLGDELSGVILDLRNNPGGVLESAVAMVDLFISDGLIVYTEGQVKEHIKRYHGSGGAEFTDIPLIVIINQGSASAAEIVAGALKDHKRALIIGQTSFGKGSVQTVIPLPDLQAIKMTTALYYTPHGHSIQGKGVQPNITLKPTITTETEGELNRIISSQDFTIKEALKLIEAMQFAQRASL